MENKRRKAWSASRWQRECDSLMQQINRANFEYCEACGQKNEVGHHYVPKSQSSFLRYCFKNLIPLCHSCHFRHHKGDPVVAARILHKRGEEWQAWIESVRRTSIKTGVFYYKQVYQQLINLKNKNGDEICTIQSENPTLDPKVVESNGQGTNEEVKEIL